MPPLLHPEFFALLGINVFLAISLLTCLLDQYFPKTISYMYQLAALAGFGQLLISKEFLATFGEYMRFLYCFTYFIITISNVIALNVYLAFFKKLKLISRAFLGSVTVPAILVSVFFIYSYASVSSHPLVSAPAIPLESVFFVILAFDMAVLGVSVYVFFKPKWVNITITGLAALVGVSAIALGVAVLMVLGASIYVLLRLWRENLKKKQRR